MSILQTRVSKLEEVFIKFVGEMQEFKNEMKEFKNEMKAFKDEMQEFKNEMKEFKNEMQEWKVNLDKERKNETREWNKKWGHLANKMGTIVEDIISSAVGPAIKRYFQCTPYFFTTRSRKKINGVEGEFDVIAVCEDKVFIVEVKSSPNRDFIASFKDKIDIFRQLFPEYNDKDVVLIMGGLRFEENLIDYATEYGVYVLAYREWDYMDILNFEQIANK